jgi:hypothetical protein
MRRTGLVAVVPIAVVLAGGLGVAAAQTCDPVSHPCNSHAFLPMAWRWRTPTPVVSPTPTPLPLKDPYEVGNRCREPEIWHHLEPNRDYYATIYGYSDQDYFKTASLVPGMQYRINMWPPEKQDYDIDLWLAETKTTCSLFTQLTGGLKPGEGVMEQIPADGDTFSVSEEMSLVVRVISPYPRVYHDPHHYYRLRLSAFGP